MNLAFCIFSKTNTSSFDACLMHGAWHNDEWGTYLGVCPDALRGAGGHKPYQCRDAARCLANARSQLVGHACEKRQNFKRHIAHLAQTRNEGNKEARKQGSKQHGMHQLNESRTSFGSLSSRERQNILEGPKSTGWRLEYNMPPMIPLNQLHPPPPDRQRTRVSMVAA